MPRFSEVFFSAKWVSDTVMNKLFSLLLMLRLFRDCVSMLGKNWFCPASIHVLNIFAIRIDVMTLTVFCYYFIFFLKSIVESLSPCLLYILDFTHFDSRQKFSNFKTFVITVNHLYINWFIQYACWFLFSDCPPFALLGCLSFFRLWSQCECECACSCVAELCTRVGETFLWGQWIPVALLYLAHVLRTLCFFYRFLLLDKPLSQTFPDKCG